MIPSAIRTRLGWLAAGLLLLGLLANPRPVWAATNQFTRWEKEVTALEAADQANKAPKSANLFIGSSSFRLWTNLAASFPGKKIVNHGFGGSQIVDSTYFADRLIFPLKPKVIFLYAGDNDLAAGKSPEMILADFQAFVARVRTELPRAKIVFVAIKPSPKRWNLVDKTRAANRLVKDHCQRGRNLAFVDVFTTMLGTDGKPLPDIFVKDELHMNEKGYALWVPLIKKHLK